MKILVTGGAGFIGHHLVKQLVDLGHQVVVWDNLSTGKKERLPDGVKLVMIDITTDELPMEDVECVFHLAAPTSVQESLENPTKYEKGCFDMVKKVFEWSIANNIKQFVFSSTSAIYGDSENVPFGENQPENPLSPYAQYKLQSEKHLKTHSLNTGCKVSVMRFFNVFGEEQPSTGSYAPAVAKFLLQYNKALPITVTGDGLQTRDYVYVKDVVRALIKTIENNEYIYEIFNVGSGVESKIIDIANYFNGVIEYVEARKEPKRSCSDIIKIKNVLGWKPTTNVIQWLDNLEKK
jgi:UDP-glucose 4-epimerase